MSHLNAIAAPLRFGCSADWPGTGIANHLPLARRVEATIAKNTASHQSAERAERSECVFAKETA